MNRVWNRAPLMLALGTALAFLGIPPRAASIPPDIKEAFPSIPGWQRVDDTTVYVPDNLWVLINGAADAFLSYGFVNLHAAEYRRSDGTQVQAEVYRHSSPTNAFGIYSQERRPENRFVAIGTEGYFEHGAVSFLAGSHYVKLSTQYAGLSTDSVLLLIARHIDRHLGESTGWPPELALLPGTGRIPYTETFVAGEFLGHSVFRSVFSARYNPAKPFQVFLMRFDSPATLASALGTYLNTIPHKLPQAPSGRTSVLDPHNGPVHFLWRGSYLAGAVGTNEASARDQLDSLDHILKNLPSR